MKECHFGLIALIYFLCVSMYLAFYYPSGEGDLVQTFLIHVGSSNREIAQEMEKRGIISSSTLFIAYAYFSDQNRLIAGNYQFGGSESISQIVNKIAVGRFYQIKVTFPEGSTTDQMASLLEKTGICSQESYLDLIQQPELFNRNWLDGAQSLEGYLFPDTYFFPPAAEVSHVIETQLKRFEEMYPGNLVEEKFSTLNKKVILASIIEREAQEKSEKPVVASVFLNRLQAKMKLESCATVIYAWKKEKGIQLSSLTIDDLKIDSPYNTYLYQGLPPTPICNPGLDSLQAVFEPSQTDYYYFVLGENGSHSFSRTYDEHLKNKKKNNAQ